MILCPCIDCLCIPICREKTYSQLVNACKFVPQFVLITDTGLDPRRSNPRHRDVVRMYKLHEVLKPRLWKLVNSTFKGEPVVVIGWTAEGMKRLRDG